MNQGFVSARLGTLDDCVGPALEDERTERTEGTERTEKTANVGS